MVRIMNGIIEKIEEERERQEIHKKDLAAAVGREPSWYSKILAGEIELRVNEFVDIAARLDVPPFKLLPNSEPIVEFINMPLPQLIRKICRNEIEGYLKKEKT